MVETLFEKYRRRLVRIGLVKSLILALIVGFTVDGIAALTTWFVIDMSIPAILGISIGLGLFAVAGCIPAFYFLFFRPTTYGIAQLLDGFELEERAITMCEFEKDPSYIAMLQRDDAKKNVSRVSVDSLKLRISTIAIVLLAVSFLFAASFTTVSALAANDVIVRGGDITKGDDGVIEDPINKHCTVTYLILYGNGRIEGENPQTVKQGDNTTQVTAVPDKGYAFYMWTNETGEELLGLSATRMEFNVQEDMNVYAVFVEANANSGDNGEQGDGEGEGQGGEGSDSSGGDQEGDGDPGADGQGDPSDGEGEGQGEGGDNQGDGGQDGDGGQGEGEGEGQGEDGDSQGDGNKGEGESSDGDPSGGAGAGGSRQNNTVIDGEQNYKDAFDRDKYEEDLANDDSIPDDLKDILGDYYDTLKP